MSNIEGAPKFGNDLYDPLMYEAMKHGQLDYNNPPYARPRTQDNEFDGTDDDDFLENSDGENKISAVPTLPRETQNIPRMETTSAPVGKKTTKSTNKPNTIIDPTSKQIKQSSPLDNLMLRKIITGSLTMDTTIHVEKATTPILKTRNEKTIAIARSSCTSCVGNVQNYQSVALRQGDGDGGSVKKSGYDYDENMCKIISGRVLCGYNKNLGEIPDGGVISKINGDCQLRDDRIECGYVPGNKPADVIRSKLPVNDKSVELSDSLSEDNSGKSEILRDSSLTLTNGVRESPESLGYPTDSTKKSVDVIERSNSEPVEFLSTYFDNVNNAIGNIEPTTLPLFSDSPDIIDYVTTVNDSINFVAEAQVERRVEEDGQLSDTNGPAFNNFDRNYLQNPDSIKEENEPHVEVTSDSSNYKKVTRCVEIGDRIVCYNIQLKDITPHM